jgi:hypothetical protein
MRGKDLNELSWLCCTKYVVASSYYHIQAIYLSGCDKRPVLLDAPCQRVY